MPAERKSEFVGRSWTSPMSCRLASCGTRSGQQPIRCIWYWRRSALRCDSAMFFTKSTTADGRTWTHTSWLELFPITESITRRSSSTPNLKFGFISMTPMYKRSVEAQWRQENSRDLLLKIWFECFSLYYSSESSRLLFCELRLKNHSKFITNEPNFILGWPKLRCRRGQVQSRSIPAASVALCSSPNPVSRSERLPIWRVCHQHLTAQSKGDYSKSREKSDWSHAPCHNAHTKSSRLRVSESQCHSKQNLRNGTWWNWRLHQSTHRRECHERSISELECDSGEDLLQQSQQQPDQLRQQLE